jgi:DNA polymerase-3 subunit chi
VARIDFYQLSRDPVERVVPLLAAKAIATGGRLLIVEADAGRRAALSQALWEHEAAFLVHGETSRPHEARQPILLGDSCNAGNGAKMILIADGEWREEAATFDRAILLFGNEQTDSSRRLWTALGSQGHELRIFKQFDAGGWREGR